MRCGSIAYELIPYWLKNLPTYGIVCTLFWPTATGILCSTIDRKIVQSSKLPAKTALLWVLLLISALLGIEDKFQARTMQVYEVQQLCKYASQYLQMQHKIIENNPVCEQLEESERAMQAGLAVKSTSDIIAKSNPVAWIQSVVQVYYSMIIGVFLWFSLIVVSIKNETPSQSLQLSAITLLFALWIPMRVYQKYIQSRYLTCDFYSSSITISCLLLMILLGMLIAKKRKIDLDTVLKVVVFLIASFALIMGELTNHLDFLAGVVHRLRFSLVIALYCFTLIALMLLGYHFTSYQDFYPFPIEVLDTSNRTPQEELFYQQAKEIVEQRFEDSRFGVFQLADEMGMGRSNFHLKFRAIFQVSPGEYIRSIRLETASDLLKKNAGTIAEIAYQVGYSNPANFSRGFKQRYGISPSQYIKNHHINNDKMTISPTRRFAQQVLKIIRRRTN